MNIRFVSTLQNVDLTHKVPLLNLPIDKNINVNNLARLSGGGGDDDKFFTLFVKKGYDLVSARQASHIARG